MKVHFIMKPVFYNDVATPVCDRGGLVTTPYWVHEKEIQSHWKRQCVTCKNCKRTKLFRKIK